MGTVALMSPLHHGSILLSYFLGLRKLITFNTLLEQSPMSSSTRKEKYSCACKLNYDKAGEKKQLKLLAHFLAEVSTFSRHPSMIKGKRWQTVCQRLLVELDCSQNSSSSILSKVVIARKSSARTLSNAVKYHRSNDRKSRQKEPTAHMRRRFSALSLTATWACCVSRIYLHEFRCRLLSPHCKHDVLRLAWTIGVSEEFNCKELLRLLSSVLDNLDDGTIKKMRNE